LNSKVEKVPGFGLSSNDYTTAEKNKLASLGDTTAFKPFLGLVIPAFRTANKFDYLGAALPATQLAIHASGTGLVSPAAGTVAEGYLKLVREVTTDQFTRKDWLLSWDTTEANASISVGLGDAATGLVITIANSGGNVVVTKPSGATASGALTGTVSIGISIASGNMGLTSSVHLLGAPLALATANVWRGPIYEYTAAWKPNLAHAYFKTTATSCKIVGFLDNALSWDGDPNGVLLTRTMAINAAGVPGDHDSYIIIPERANLFTPLRVAHFFHGRTQTAYNLIDVASTDAWLRGMR
jgi:hypothetical protein